MLDLTFIGAGDGTPLTKTFTVGKDGGITTKSYPMVKNLTSYSEQIDSMNDFYDAIVRHTEKGHCLLKGKLDRPLINESRAGHTDAHTETLWVVLDNDHLHNLSPQQLMDLIGLDVDYVVQYSASAGIISGKNGYHIFFRLKTAASPEQLKLLLKHWNLNIPEIRKHISLSRTKQALLWPLDITVCQNDKLIFIAPPNCGPGITSVLTQPRITFVSGASRSALIGDLA